MSKRKIPETKNYWNLIFGILFLGYGSFRAMQLTQQNDQDTFRIVLAMGFIAVGIYEIYKFFKILKQKENR